MTFLSSFSLSSKAPEPKSDAKPTAAAATAAAALEDAPLSALGAAEAAALDALDAALGPLFTAAAPLHADDPWRLLPSDLRRHLLLRFARYHLLDAGAAEAHIRRVADARAATRPWRHTLQAARERRAGLVMHVGASRGSDNELWMYLPARYYVRSAVDHDVQRVAITAFFEHCLYAADGPRGAGGVIVVDYAELGVRNVDLVAVRNGIHIFLDQYPESFKRIVFVNYPKWMYGTWKCVAPLLDARTVAKIAWLRSFDDVGAEMARFFDRAALPSWLGGAVSGDKVALENGDELTWDECAASMHGEPLRARKRA